MPGRRRPGQAYRCVLALRRPLRDVGWKIEFVCLPVQRTALRGLPLPRPCAPAREARRRCRRADVAARRRVVPHARRHRRRRHRAVARVAAVRPGRCGIGTSGVRYTYQTSLPRDVTGQFLRTPRGPVKLFAWAIRRRPIRTTRCACTRPMCAHLMVRAAAVDNPKAYDIYDLDGGAPCVSPSTKYGDGARARPDPAAPSGTVRLRRDARGHVRRP